MTSTRGMSIDTYFLDLTKSDDEEDKEDSYFRVLGIDPGTTNLGVCLLLPSKDTSESQVQLLHEFNLKDFAPSEKSFSCYTKGSVCATTIGECIANMILSCPHVFGTFDKHARTRMVNPWTGSRERTTREELVVVVEKQMNISPNNCCVLSALQTFYISRGIRCYIFSPSTFNAHFPLVFDGTKGSRAQRKASIKAFGSALLTRKEKLAAAETFYMWHPEDKYKDMLKSMKRDLAYSRKRNKQIPFSIHALDAMFYALVCMIKHDEVGVDLFAGRVQTMPILKKKLKETSIRRAKAMLAKAAKEAAALDLSCSASSPVPPPKTEKKRKSTFQWGKKTFWKKKARGN